MDGEASGDTNKRPSGAGAPLRVTPRCEARPTSERARPGIGMPGTGTGIGIGIGIGMPGTGIGAARQDGACQTLGARR